MDVVGRQLVLLRQLDDQGEQARWRLFAVHESREPVADVGDIRVGPGGLWLRLFAGDPCRRRRSYSGILVGIPASDNTASRAFAVFWRSVATISLSVLLFQMTLFNLTLFG